MSEMSQWIGIGQVFKPFAWKANFDMDFSSECMYCDSNESLKGYTVENEEGSAARVAICPACRKINARY
ncbi:MULTISPECIES: hypothetical protein [Aneurinibacillus]|uniref:Uncharacterized protein n=1 Tax=Aneurinibacillus danicus TaxID=267746 RepID=A0A511V2Q5_9BACL|nr:MULTISPECIES: hypothetical protein [Aneurinibacillus]GEN33196.1 hypothetical protein ADA01nite_06560 [Aneurinibacillus danicus]